MVIGIDEVGRGALAGPVMVGAACILNPDRNGLVSQIEDSAKIARLKDSKKLSAGARERVFAVIEAREDIRWAVGAVGSEEIDKNGLSRALREAAGIAISSLPKAEGIIADAGLYHPFETEMPTERIVRGDETVLEIMVASIMAKVSRDRKMRSLAGEYPRYAFDRHVGYATAVHRDAIAAYGLTPVHRKSFCRSIHCPASKLTG